MLCRCLWLALLPALSPAQLVLTTDPAEALMDQAVRITARGAPPGKTVTITATM